ncbi:TIGR03089 family protein [Nocardioides sp. LHD-245]|uniref:TIGR03089 family protein n=1 Tax=Nocardioides sp. LHD-245 TaxID=3051387 RepID=UPI0027DF71A1|nr:TIGR03089 family protein [Nocardioides sp. LHD-245]
MTSPSTFPAVLSARLRTDPGQPLVTFYDHATGERVELSVTTWANWVAKASSLLVDELGLERGDRIAVDLPPHWLGTVFLGAAWNCGLIVAATDDPDLAAAVCGPDSLDTWAVRAGDLAVLASALLPLGVRFADPIPDGVTDVGVDIWSQPDAFQAWDPPQPDDLAIEVAGRSLTQAELWSEAAATGLVGNGRLLAVADPVTEPAILCEPLLSGGSLVLVARAEPERLEATYVAEHATARFPA